MFYDYLIVGAGLFGAVFACEMKKKGRRCLVIDKREHLGGNIYTEEIMGIHVHKYGAHIFHTSNKKVWEYINQYAEFNRFVNSPMAIYQGELYPLPFNMNTFYKMWGVKTPAEARKKIAEQIAEFPKGEPRNLEEQALLLVGRDIYEKLIQGYTEKQWGRACTELPPFIIKRIPLRFTYDNNYFNDLYQGIPIGGYTSIVEKLLEGVEVHTGVNYKEWKEKESIQGIRWGKLLYTGMIDEYFDYRLGALEYRSLRFEQETIAECDNWQGNAVFNYTEREVPYTRIIEHKHFEFGTQKGTVITREYPAAWQLGEESYYPVNDEKNQALFQDYQKLAEAEPGVLFGGRLGQYKYYDMDQVIAAALDMAEQEGTGAKEG
ncbi:MAG: UDP-galactopyranose mutase [Lachnospiraceae bacterium]|nr:UDP-galactopyranose mutase [Lachnospiraceae bacterium]